MPETTRSGGQLLVDGLAAGGVKHAFCVPGESYLAALDAFYERRAGMQLIACRQEGGASYMAEAYAKLSGQPGVCLVSRGPGAANAMIGVHTAFQDSTPMLLCIGQNPLAHRGREGFQELHYEEVYAGVAKRVLRVSAARDVPGMLREAWASAVGGRPGPVVLELPEDMLRERVAPPDGFDSPPPPREARAPSADEVARFGELLNAAARPLVICGGAAWTPRANRLLAEFAERHALPVACAFRRQDTFDNSDPRYAGELGLAAGPKLLELAKQSDLVIAIAARLGEMTTADYTLFDSPEFDKSGERKLAHIFPHAGEFNSVYAAELGIESDAAEFLQAALELAPPPAALRESRETRAAAAHQNYLEHTCAPRNENGNARVRLDEVVKYLRENLPPDSILANGAGNYTVWPQRHYQFRRPKTQLACTNGSMGYGAPAAIAGKIFRPNSTVVSFSGDGCFLMNGQELATAAQYGVNVIFIVINNSCYGTIRSHQERHYPGRPVATALQNPDFPALARAYRAFGAVVTRTEEFAGAFESAVRANTPALIEIQTEE